MSVQRWVHIAEMGSNPWVLPIWNAVNRKVEAGLINQPGQSMYDLGLSLTTHLNMIPKIGCRLEKSLISLRANVCATLNEESIFSNESNGYALRINDDLKYELLIDRSTFLFQINLTWELQKKLFKSIRDWLGQPIKESLGVEVQKVVGGNDWFPALDNLRNFFMHEGAPYIAFDVTKGSDFIELIIMKENVSDFKNLDTFIKIDMLNEIVKGFSSANTSLQNYLIDLINDLGKQ